MIIETALLFFALASWGCFVLLPIVKLREIGQGFYRFFALLCASLAALGVGAAFLGGPGLPETFRRSAAALALYAFLLLAFSFSLRSKSLRLVWTLFALASLAGFAASCILPFYGFPGGWFFMGRAATSALTLGSGVLAMMLGHWYLVQPRLSIGPLKRYAALYILLTAWTAAEIASAWSLDVGADWMQPATGAGTKLVGDYLVFVLMRVVWGLGAPLGLAYWIWNTVKMRATQSATGILYPAMVATAIGEALGIYLTLATGVPF